MVAYRTGTISVTQGSQAVVGVTTEFVDNARIGDFLVTDDDALYEITDVTSDLAITITSSSGGGYGGATGSGKSYVIIPTVAWKLGVKNQLTSAITSFNTIINGAGAGKFTAGTVSVPTLRDAADLDTGVNFAGGNVLQLVANGAEVVNVGTGGVGITGELGIGTNSPVSDIHIKSSNPTVRLEDTDGTVVALIYSNSDGDITFSADPDDVSASSSFQFNIDGGEVARMTAAGRLAINKTSADLMLHTFGTSANGLRMEYSSDLYSQVSVNSNGDLILAADGGDSASGSDIQLTIDGTIYARLFPALFAIGEGKSSHSTTTDGISWGVNGAGSTIASDVSDGSQILMNVQNYVSGTHYFFGLRANNATVGTIGYNGTNTVYATTSDKRMKENILPAMADDFFDRVEVVQFDWIDADTDTHVTHGLIAQDLHQIAPEAVAIGDTPDAMWGVDPGKLVPRLIQEIQTLRTRIDALAGSIDT